MERESRRIVAAVLLWWSGSFTAAGWLMENPTTGSALLLLSAGLALAALVFWPKERESIAAPVKTLFKYGCWGNGD